MYRKGLLATIAVEGAASTEVFSTYLDRVLCPALRRGQTVLLNNLRVHEKRGRVQENRSESVFQLLVRFPQPRQGRKKRRPLGQGSHPDILAPLPGLDVWSRFPTVDAVSYLLPPLPKLKTLRANEKRCKLYRLVFLPRCSPDFNPIEDAFSKLKAFLRRRAARTPRTLRRAIAQGLATITARNADG